MIGIIYGTSTGNTATVAEMIAAELGPDVAAGPFDIDSVAETIGEELAKYDALIVGTPTWNTGADTERSGTGWDELYYSSIQGLNLQGKKVAVFGLGDQVSYSENYADATGELHDVFERLGCKMMGYTSQDGYEHESSKSIRGDKFCGLLLDMINQEDLTPNRVKNWIAQLKLEGFLDAEDSTTPPPAAKVTAHVVQSSEMPTPSVATSNNVEDAIAKLERENAELRKLLQTASLSEPTASANNGFTPHFNPKTGRTMWTSPNGRFCYYTVDKSKLSP
jgi:flavodoxin I